MTSIDTTTSATPLQPPVAQPAATQSLADKVIDPYNPTVNVPLQSADYTYLKPYMIDFVSQSI
jgi:hypothetical protein